MEFCVGRKHVCMCHVSVDVVAQRERANADKTGVQAAIDKMEFTAAELKQAITPDKVPRVLGESILWK